ncbi:MAG: hypothetical protein H6624_11420 [Bdellovibrionaceae bacterium]|nr:hypothetical protein [Bdellovibrionales bacterium]MCB9084948.1 hypothetical protein [Pseudobdellovibrionaceae bacterium]
MSSYVSSEMAEVVHCLTNVMGVRTLCNDGSLPFGGQFRVNLDIPQLGHGTHDGGKHIDLRYFSDQDCSAFLVDPGDRIPFKFQGAINVNQPVIPDEHSACDTKGSFEDYYDHPKASRRIKDWDHTKEFLADMMGLSETARQTCLTTSSTCPELIAQKITPASVSNYYLELEKNRRISVRNLAAMKRLSRWVVYNRRTWTALSLRFDKVQVMISFIKETDSRPEWQKKLFLDGTVDDHDMLSLSADGSGLVRIGSCDEDAQCDLHQEPGDNKNLRNDGASGHIDHLHLGIYQ